VFDFGDTRYGHRHDLASIDLSQNAGNWSQGIRLLTIDGTSVLPTVSPDGKRITFISESSAWSGGRYGRLSSLCFIKKDGTNRKSVVPVAKPDSLQAGQLMTWTRAKFSPDGKYLFFLADQAGLWRMDANGKNLIQIADQALFTKPLAWKASP
jgi:Tol biopolymer transport system component